MLSGAGGRHVLVTDPRASNSVNAAPNRARNVPALPYSVTLLTGATNGTVKGYQLAAERAADTLAQAGIEVRISHDRSGRPDANAGGPPAAAGTTPVADAYVVLPGGAGTLMEFFEVWTGQQQGTHARPVALLNINGFFDGLLKAIDQMIIAGFLPVQDREALIVARDPHDLLAQLAVWRAPVAAWATAS